jgi:hypothetical protein
MNTLELDPKPWQCINCSDRFVHNQTSASIHWTEFRPRPLYSQDGGEYR